MIAGTNSGCGKTTITCAILKNLLKNNLEVMSYKCGPDYIDPMFHRKIIGTDSGNLDLFLTDEDTVKYLLKTKSENYDISVIEGVMGLYDGRGGDTEYASSNHVSRITNTPVVLVVDAKGISLSLLAVLKGYLTFSENNIKGVIFNRMSEKVYSKLKKKIEQTLPIKVLGYFPQTSKTIESRHLGLMTADEVENINEMIDAWQEQAEKYIDFGLLMNIVNEAEPIVCSDIVVPKLASKLKIAVAYDRAFCFYYKENFELLEKMGVQLEFFSPLQDEDLPPNVSGLILGGGYPELHLQELNKNTKMCRRIKSAIQSGMPCIAECGGFLYLLEKLDGIKLVGAISGEAHMTKKLVNFGYKTIVAELDNLLCKSGESINVHEFHYSDCDQLAKGFQHTETLYAGYHHLHFWGNRKSAERFIEKCKEFRFVKGE